MKTEMVNALNSSIVGGNLVQVDNKNRYHVTDKNGKKKVLTADQFKKNVDKNYDKIKSGEEFNFKKPMSFMQKATLTLLGIGAAAALIYNKKIAEFFKGSKTKETLTNLAESESGQAIRHAINETKEKARDILNNPKKYATKADELFAKGTEKAINGIGKVVDFFRGFKKK